MTGQGGPGKGRGGGSMTDGRPPRLEVSGASKTFGSARVLRDVNLTIQPGEIHGLVGENGSGKSTLVKVLTGYHAPDPGAAVRVDGQPLRLPVRWEEAHAAQISVVHQDLGLLDRLTVAENVGVGGYRRSRWLHRVNWRHESIVAKGLMERLHLPSNPKAIVGELPPVARAGVAIARALRDQQPGSGLIILDEATRLLSGDDLRHFHQVLRRLANEGISVLLVSHNLEEVLRVTDRVTVLRDGNVAGEGLLTASLTEQDMADRMLGKTISALEPRPAVNRPPGVSVTGLRGGLVEGLDLALAEGEVVGLTGLPGSGFEDIPYLLAGTRPVRGGSLSLGGKRLNLRDLSVRAAIQGGIVLVPERRDRDGLALELSITDNVTLPDLNSFGSQFFVSRRRQHETTRKAIKNLGIKASSPHQLIKELSGGNQQKALLAKWLSVQPRLLILHEPTQAVDVGARLDLLRAVHAAADTGVAVLLVSIQPADLVSACDRILIYQAPGTVTELDAREADEILDAVYGRDSIPREGA